MRVRRLVNAMVAVTFFANYSGLGYAQSLPTLASVDAGSIATSMPNATTMDIAVGADRSIGNYSNFDIAAGHTVNINHATAGWSSLHRDTGGDLSSIFGNLNSNGRVFLINPNGVTFGAGSRIDLPGLVASAKPISNADFTSGQYNFTTGGSGAVINQGNINITGGGILALLSSGTVSNEGAIVANSGQVLLASGDAMTVGLGSNISAVITTGANGVNVANSGLIDVGSGRVLLTAKSLNNVLDNIVNNTGTIRAVSVVNGNGQVELSAFNGSVNNTGSITSANITLSATNNATVNGRLKATNDVNITAGRHVNQGGVIVATHDVNITADSDHDGVGDFTQSDGAGILAGHDVSVSAQNQAIKRIQAANNINLTAAGDVRFLTGNASIASTAQWWMDYYVWDFIAADYYSRVNPLPRTLAFSPGNFFADPTLPFDLTLYNGQNVSDTVINLFQSLRLQGTGFQISPFGSANPSSGFADFFSPTANTVVYQGSTSLGAPGTPSYQVAFNQNGDIQINYRNMGAGATAGQNLVLSDGTGGHQQVIPAASIAGNRSVLLTERVDVSGANVEAGNNVTITAGGRIIDDNGTALDIKANQIDLTAVNGIGVNDPIETSAVVINAGNSGVGNIDLSNTSTGDLQLNVNHTGTGDVDVSQQGGGDLIIGTVRANNGDAAVQTVGSGDIVLGLVSAVDNEATVNAAGSIIDGDLIDESFNVVGNTVNLIAGGSIGWNVPENADIDVSGDSITSVVGPGGSAFIGTVQPVLVLPTIPAGDISNSLNPRFIFPSIENMVLHPVTPSDALTSIGSLGPVLFYHPLTEVDSGAYSSDGLNLDEGAYDFIDGRINPNCSEEEMRAGLCKKPAQI